MHCCFFFQEPILKIWLQIVVKAGAINFDALHQLLYLLRFVFARSNHDTTLRTPGLRNARATILTPSNTPAEAVTHYVRRPSVGMILTPPRLANIGESRPSLMSLLW